MNHAGLYSSGNRPPVIQPDFASIPAAMKDEPRWILWRLEWNGRWSKVPYSIAGYRASTAKPQTWSDFATIQAAYERGGYDGIGFVLGDGWAGIDLDDCRNTDTHQISGWAKNILRAVDSYTEVSPSGTGVKIFGYGFHAGANQFSYGTGSVEMYDGGRYFCVTGHEGCRELADISNGMKWLASSHTTQERTAVRARPTASVERRTFSKLENTPENAAAMAELFTRWYGEEIGA